MHALAVRERRVLARPHDEDLQPRRAQPGASKKRHAFQSDVALDPNSRLPMQEQMRERGIQLEVRALANDTVGTMEAAAYAYPDTTMGVILGTGTNAAYIEKGSKLGKWKGPPRHRRWSGRRCSAPHGRALEPNPAQSVCVSAKV